MRGTRAGRALLAWTAIVIVLVAIVVVLGAVDIARCNAQSEELGTVNWCGLRGIAILAVVGLALVIWALVALVLLVAARLRVDGPSAGLIVMITVSLLVVVGLVVELAPWRSRDPENDSEVVRSPGALHLSIDTSDQRLAATAGSATCEVYADGSYAVSGAFKAPSDAPGEVSVRVGPTATYADMMVVLDGRQAFPGKGWSPGPDTTPIAAGATVEAGRVRFRGLVPSGDDGEPDYDAAWSGTLDWTCPSGAAGARTMAPSRS